MMEVHIVVKGRVQGVGFRAAAQYQARRIGVVGTVRNMTDGSVEIYALGTKAAVESFIAILRNGLGAGHVSEFFWEEVNPPRQYVAFKII